MNKKGISLIEIMLAMGFLLTVLAPLMVGMGSSVKATIKADSMTAAVNAACSKMNLALSMPFGELEDIYTAPFGGEDGKSPPWRHTFAGQTLVLGNEGSIRSSLKLDAVDGNFTVPTYDVDKRYAEKKPPKDWGWEVLNTNTSFRRDFYRYTLTIYWQDYDRKRNGEPRNKSYTLVSYKANIRRPNTQGGGR